MMHRSELRASLIGNVNDIFQRSMERNRSYCSIRLFAEYKNELKFAVQDVLSQLRLRTSFITDDNIRKNINIFINRLYQRIFVICKILNIRKYIFC